MHNLFSIIENVTRFLANLSCKLQKAMLNTCHHHIINVETYIKGLCMKTAILYIVFKQLDSSTVSYYTRCAYWSQLDKLIILLYSTRLIGSKLFMIALS